MDGFEMSEQSAAIHRATNPDGERPDLGVCRWFVLCVRDAAGTVWHPLLGDVPTCQPCADRLDLDLVDR